MTNDQLIYLPLLNKCHPNDIVKNNNFKFHFKYVKKIKNLNFSSQITKSDIQYFDYFLDNLSSLSFDCGVDSPETLIEISKKGFKKLRSITFTDFQYEDLDLFEYFSSLSLLSIFSSSKLLKSKKLKLDFLSIYNPNLLELILEGAKIKSLEINNDGSSPSLIYLSDCTDSLSCDTLNIDAIQGRKNLIKLEVKQFVKASHCLEKNHSPNVFIVKELYVENARNILDINLLKIFPDLEKLSFNISEEPLKLIPIIKNSKITDLNLGSCKANDEVTKLQANYPNLKIIKADI